MSLFTIWTFAQTSRHNFADRLTDLKKIKSLMPYCALIKPQKWFEGKGLS